MIKYSLLLFVVVFLSCVKDKAANALELVESTSNDSFCDTVSVSFSASILPIFNQSCATSNCHNSTSASAGYILGSHTQISSNATIALKSIQHNGASAMPKAQPKLNDSLIQQFECWIKQGKLNN